MFLVRRFHRLAFPAHNGTLAHNSSNTQHHNHNDHHHHHHDHGEHYNEPGGYLFNRVVRRESLVIIISL